MHRTVPSVFLVAETRVVEDFTDSFNDYFESIGALGWKTDAPSGAEKLIEIMGRLCYKAFGVHLNANIKKVREGNEGYLANIIKSGHGSVLEHASVSFIFHNVSRVFTHELVRHRAGCAMSQESLRYVRLTDLGLWLPRWADRPDGRIRELFEETFDNIEQLQLEMSKAFKLDDDGVNFSYKKKMTSLMRRLAPIGLSTSIGFTMNHRALRHILAMRTSRHAEEEIRLVFAQVGRICKIRYPNLYADFKSELVDGIEEFTTMSNKI